MESILGMLELFGIMIGIFVVGGVVIYFFMSLFGNVKQYKAPFKSKGPFTDDQINEATTNIIRNSYYNKKKKQKKKKAGVNEKETSKQESSSNLNDNGNKLNTSSAQVLFQKDNQLEMVKIIN